MQGYAGSSRTERGARLRLGLELGKCWQGIEWLPEVLRSMVGI